MLPKKIVLLALLTFVACNAGKDERSKIVSGKKTMPVLNIQLPDDSFWSDINNVLPEVKAEARKTDFLGIYLAGPQMVDLEKHANLSLFGLRRASLREAFYARLETHAVIVGISKSDNSVFAAMAWENKSEGPEDYTPPKAGFPEGTSISPFQIEIRDRVEDLPWVPGGKTFILYLFDQQSNPVEIQFHKDLSESSGVENRAQHGSQLLIQPEPNLLSGHSFNKQPESPEIPAAGGISIRIVCGPEDEGDRKCIAHGAFRLKPLACEVLRPQKSNPIPGFAAETSAILPITLLVLGEALTGPFSFPIRCPAIPATEKGFVTGYFNVNLLEMQMMFGVPQRYVVRALHGSARSEPEIFSLK